MMRLGKEHLADMSNEGDRVKARRERLGMDKLALAKLAGVNRNTLTAIEKGESFNRSTLAKIERALDELEHEAGIDAPPASSPEHSTDLFEFEVTGPDGLQIVARGPVRDADALRRQVVDIIREIRRESDTP